VITQVKRDSPSLAFRYTVFATMFSNSINSSLIGFLWPNRMGEEEALWSMVTSVSDVGGERDGSREVDRWEHVRLLSHGVDGTSIRQAPICVPADTTGVYNRSPFREDQMEIRVSSRCTSIRKHRLTNLNVTSDDSLFDQSTGWTHLKSIRFPEEKSLEWRRVLAISSFLLRNSLKEKQHLLLD